MNYWLFSLGVFILSFVVIDVILTTFAPTGAGMITGRLRRWIWSIFLWASNRNGASSTLNYAGPVTVVVWLMGWLFMVWAGNTLIYLSDPNSVIVPGSMRSATWQEKIYFTGYTLSTLGIGDFVPYGTGWQIFSSFISFSGFILITITLTYLYSVVTNDINRRKVSLKIYNTGSTPQEILLRYWNGRNFNRLNEDLSALSGEILQVAQNHMAYPVLHNFHSTRRGESLAINITSLDEALTILLLYKPKDTGPALPDLYELRSAITFYLQTLQNAFIKPTENEPPAPNMEPLLANGLPLEGAPFHELVGDGIKLRRKLLNGLLYSQGWNWDALETNHSTDPLDNWLTTMRKQRLYEWPTPYKEVDEEEQLSPDE